MLGNARNAVERLMELRDELATQCAFADAYRWQVLDTRAQLSATHEDAVRIATATRAAREKNAELSAAPLVVADAA